MGCWTGYSLRLVAIFDKTDKGVATSPQPGERPQKHIKAATEDIKPMEVDDIASFHDKDTLAIDTRLTTTSAPAAIATSANGGFGVPAEVLPLYKRVSTRGDSDASEEMKCLKATIADMPAQAKTKAEDMTKLDDAF
ncbi:hypothetical protein LTR37_001510 [Vermiconidia calcicola]|uniref:Uncharacterized protein n=1 Tax=Vermiconidia calcicola TaxID=1690605 RepID=A0ACC3NUW4_9PEZI|nr:hypothetical protein LTR37_001510 [Vermiconidia calcicola]